MPANDSPAPTVGTYLVARKNGERVRLYSRPGNDLTKYFPLLADALAALKSRSCIIDVDRLRYWDRAEGVDCNYCGRGGFPRQVMDLLRSSHPPAYLPQACVARQAAARQFPRPC
jgi:hypothetical protein